MQIDRFNESIQNGISFDKAFRFMQIPYGNNISLCLLYSMLCNDDKISRELGDFCLGVKNVNRRKFSELFYFSSNMYCDKFGKASPFSDFNSVRFSNSQRVESLIDLHCKYALPINNELMDFSIPPFNTFPVEIYCSLLIKNDLKEFDTLRDTFPAFLEDVFLHPKLHDHPDLMFRDDLMTELFVNSCYGLKVFKQ